MSYPHLRHSIQLCAVGRNVASDRYDVTATQVCKMSALLSFSSADRILISQSVCVISVKVMICDNEAKIDNKQQATI